MPRQKEKKEKKGKKRKRKERKGKEIKRKERKKEDKCLFRPRIQRQAKFSTRHNEEGLRAVASQGLGSSPSKARLPTKPFQALLPHTISSASPFPN